MKKKVYNEAYWRKRDLDRIKQMDRLFTIKIVGAIISMVLFLIVMMLYMNVIDKRPVKEQNKTSQYGKT